MDEFWVWCLYGLVAGLSVAAVAVVVGFVAGWWSDEE
jgi:hypothetical protein